MAEYGIIVKWYHSLFGTKERGVSSWYQDHYNKRNIMKIAITGHAQGIGKSLTQIYQKNGHTVIGFSRSNGFDISDPAAREQIVIASQECDMFINNAYSRKGGNFAQVELLFDIWESWKNQHKTILNISSSITEKWQTNHPIIAYRVSKQALENACEFLYNHSQWPAVSIVSPCLTDTPPHINNPATNKVNPDDLAELVYQTMSRRDCRVQSLKLAIAPTE